MALTLAVAVHWISAEAEIENRQTAPSTMPEIFGAGLSRTDMRDLVAYLGALIVEPVKLEDNIEGF